MAKQRLVLKTAFDGKDVYRIFRDAAFAKHKGNKKVIELLKKKKTQIVIRLELKNVIGDEDMEVLVEIFEKDKA